ncbi:MAG: RCC1 domain-containing protein [Nannocystales bacterium]
MYFRYVVAVVLCACSAGGDADGTEPSTDAGTGGTGDGPHGATGGSGVEVEAEAETEASAVTTTSADSGQAEGDSDTTGGQDVAEIVALSSAAAHRCAVIEGGTLWCWGRNDDGELGNGQRGGLSPVPVQVISSAVFTSVAVGSFGGGNSIAVSDDGTVWRWGERATSVPTEVLGLPPAVGVATGSAEHCIIAEDASLWCWSPLEAPSQSEVSGVVDVTHTSAGFHFCAASSDGVVRCRGGNDDGQLGTTDPVGFVMGPPSGGPVRDLRTWSSRANLQLHGGSCLVPADGTLWCWGAAAGVNGSEAQQIAGLSNLASIGSTRGPYLRQDSTVMIDRDGTLELLLDDVTLIGPSCAAKDDGTIWCWGSNANGGLGDGTVDDSDDPVQVTPSWLE